MVVSSIEHPSVPGPAARIRKLGATVRRVDPDRAGRVHADAITDALDGRTELVSIILANNETGCLQPARAVAESAHRAGLPVHSDAVQAVGKMGFDMPHHAGGHQRGGA